MRLAGCAAGCGWLLPARWLWRPERHRWPFAMSPVRLDVVAALGLAGQWSRRFGLHAVLKDGVSASLFAPSVGLLMTRCWLVLHMAPGLMPTRPSLVGLGRIFAATGERGAQSVVAGLALAGAGDSGTRHHAQNWLAKRPMAGGLVPEQRRALLAG
jgi:hypothetical protein